ncbi:hypothetical protein [Actinotalea sp.]|uniref:hypothetical protein n=1 Tax=Actinotalea sp. TaxID=1872145 RepID=UPI003561F015
MSVVRAKGGAALTVRAKGGAVLTPRMLGESVGTPSTFPTQATVGLAGVGLTVGDLSSGWAPGDFYGSADGAVWTGYDITCTYPMEFPVGDAGKTITFRNCRIYGGPAEDPYVYWSVLTERGVKLVFEDCDLIGGLDSAISGSNYTLRRCLVYGGGDGLKFANDVLIEDSYVKAYINPSNPDPHADGMQSLGTNGTGAVGSGATIRRNSIVMPNDSTSAIILSTGSASDMRDVLIEENYLEGGINCIYGGYQSGVDTLSKVSNIIIRNNRFKRGNNTVDAITSADSPVVQTGNVWHDTGLPV